MVQILVNGLLLGSSYALLAVGYTLVFGITRLLTLAQGTIFMVSGVVAVLAMKAFGLPLALGFVVALAVGAAGGLVTDVLCFRLVEPGALSQTVATLGLAIVIQGAAVVLWGSEPIGLPRGMRATDLHLGSVLVSSVQLVMLALALALMAGIHRFVFHTRWGAALRALGEDPGGVSLVGINGRSLATAVLAASGLLAGLSGFLVTLRVGSINPFSGFEVGLQGIAIMAIAGLGSVTGAVAVGIALGVFDAFAVYYNMGALRSAIPWILVILVLLLRPQGLFGPRTRR